MATQRASLLICDAFVTGARHHLARGQWHLDAAVAVRADALLTLTPDSDLSDSVEPLVEVARHVGADHILTSLLIPDAWVLSHRIARTGPRLDTSAAAYAFEEFSPLPLEELTCTFLPAPDGDLFAVAVATRPLRALLDALARENVHVDEIHPRALAAARDTADAAGTIWLDRRSVSFVIQDAQGRVSAMRTARGGGDGPPDAAFVDAQRDLLPEPASAVRWCAIGPAPGALVSQLTRLTDREGAYDGPALDAREPSPPTKDRGPGLRAGPLAFGGRHTETLRHASRIAALLAILLTLLAAGLHRQRSAIRTRLDAIRTREHDLYTETFPGRPVPAGIALRVASERIRLEGLTRADVDQPAERSTGKMLDALRHVAAAIPQDVHLFVQDLSLDETHLALRGTARSHAEAERIAAALRTDGRLTPTPPRSDTRREGGVTFSLHAERVSHDD